MKVNWKSYFTGLLTVVTLAFIGGVWDFQTMKAEVREVQTEVKDLKSHDKKTDDIIKAIGIIVCMGATKDQMPEQARKTCKSVLQ